VSSDFHLFFGICRIFIFLARAVKRTSKQSAVYIPGVWKTGNRFYRSKYCTRSSGMLLYTWRGRVGKLKPRYFEKFKINISTRRIQTNLSTWKRLNTRSILLHWFWANSEEFRRYSIQVFFSIRNTECVANE
jgi:hypothetical protein